MRRIILSLAAAIILGTGFATAIPTSAHAQFYGRRMAERPWPLYTRGNRSE